jgi:hypothetical protein
MPKDKPIKIKKFIEKIAFSGIKYKTVLTLQIKLTNG